MRKSNPRLTQYRKDTQILLNELHAIESGNQCHSCQIFIDILYHQLELSFDMIPLFAQFTANEEITCRALHIPMQKSELEQSIFKKQYIHKNCGNDKSFTIRLNNLANKIFEHNRNARAVGCKLL